MTIKRWSGYDMEGYADGEFVEYDDHVAEIAKWKKLAKDAANEAQGWMYSDQGKHYALDPTIAIREALAVDGEIWEHEPI